MGSSVNGCFDNGNAYAGTTAAFLTIGGTIVGNTNAESRRQFKLGQTITLRKLRTYVSANARNAANNTRSRKNGANGNLAASITASTTGWFEDNSNSDGYVDNDLIGLVQGTAAGTGSFTVEGSIVQIDSGSGNYPVQVFASTSGTGVTMNPATTYFIPLTGNWNNASITEAQSQFRVRCTGTFGNIQLNVRTNSLNVNTPLTLRKNGANGSGSVSVTAATTGIFEDGTNTDSVNSGDLINLQAAVPAGTGSMVVDVAGCTFTATENATDCMTNRSGGVSRTSSTATNFIPICGGMQEVATEANSQTKFPFAATLSRLRAYFSSAPTGSTVFTLRKNGADTAVTFSTSAGTTGWYEDATNSVTVTDGDLVCIKVSAGAASTVTYHSVGLKVAITDGVGGGGGGGGRRRRVTITN